MKLAKQINTIVCDDIRQEAGNKISLMGIYQEDIVANKIPSILSTLCFMFTFEGIKTDLSGLRIELKQSKNVTNLIQIDSFPEKPDVIETARFLAKLTPFRINNEGRVDIRVDHPDLKRPIKIFSFKLVKKQPVD